MPPLFLRTYFCRHARILLFERINFKVKVRKPDAVYSLFIVPAKKPGELGNIFLSFEMKIAMAVLGLN